MNHPKARLAISALLFLGWLGFLLYLVVDSRTVILSRPQFLVAQVIVVADLGAGPGPAVVEEVLWPADRANERLVNQPIRIAGIAGLADKQGYGGPGKYLLPLMKTMTGSYQIAPLPGPAPEARIYAWTPRLREQVDEIIQARK